MRKKELEIDTTFHCIYQLFMSDTKRKYELKAKGDIRILCYKAKRALKFEVKNYYFHKHLKSDEKQGFYFISFFLLLLFFFALMIRV